MSPAQILEPPFSTNPSTRSTASVRIIDTGVRISNVASSVFLTPPIPGFSHFSTLPGWSFLIEAQDGRKILFDLGVPQNWRETFPPALVQGVDSFGWTVEFEKVLPETLKDGGVGLESIGAIIWSHSHWDHIGDPTIFPSTTDLVVGPGFKKKFTPGYPVDPTSALNENAWENRTLREISASDFEDSGIRVGDLQALDYFGDGSVFLLNTPGHMIGHLSALVRTTTSETADDTFIFLGGDICHHGGEIRPSRFLNLPKEITPSPLLSRSVCPGSLFEPLLKSRGRAVNEPFFAPAMGEDVEEAKDSIFKAQEADGRDNVLFLFAHDEQLLTKVDLFPEYANQWKEKGWREKLLWSFLGDFESAVGKTD